MRYGNASIKLAAAVALSVFGTQAQDPTTAYVADLTALTKTCAIHLSGAYAHDDGEAAKTYICGDKKNVAYWTADMDIDCDGDSTAACNKHTDPWFQVGTAFGSHVEADKVPYYVIPNNFNLGSNGIGGGQIAAIIYKGKVTFAVLADTGPPEIIGEASYATAKIQGIPENPENGGTDGPVIYIVFTGAANRGAITLAGHADVLTKGKALAEQFIQDNGGPTGLARAPEATPGLRSVGRSLQVSATGAWSLWVRDARGRIVGQWSGKGPALRVLDAVEPGVYQAELVSGFRARTASIALF